MKEKYEDSSEHVAAAMMNLSTASYNVGNYQIAKIAAKGALDIY